MRSIRPYARVTRNREERVVTARDEEIGVGQVRRQVRLSTECLYRVCELEGEYATVEVIRAPGLAAGQRFRFTRAAVELMQCVDPHDRPRPTGTHALHT
jgi:hypothetical protein